MLTLTNSFNKLIMNGHCYNNIICILVVTISWSIKLAARIVICGKRYGFNNFVFSSLVNLNQCSYMYFVRNKIQKIKQLASYTKKSLYMYTALIFLTYRIHPALKSFQHVF